MLRPRIIPFLLLRNKGLVKTVNFKDGKYVGDPINAVKIFNEKEVDELTFLDIDASVNNRVPNYDLIKKIAKESKMPICYGGGIKNLDQALRIIELGVEKIAISSAIFDNFDLLRQISSKVGIQSVVVVLDYKKVGFFNKNEIFVKNGSVKTGLKLLDFVKKIQESGMVGELVINSIQDDGMMGGYDYETIDEVRNIFDGPMTVIGGAENLNDIKKLISKYPLIGAGAGSIFVFKGKYKAVLINYPNIETRLQLI